MPRNTVIVSPYELCVFIESHYKINNALASSMTSWVTPECEMKTYDYDLDELRDEIAHEPEEEAAYPEFPASPNQMLVDFMVAKNIAAFTLTQ
jgi:hypothetical protein